MIITEYASNECFQHSLEIIWSMPDMMKSFNDDMMNSFVSFAGRDDVS